MTSRLGERASGIFAGTAVVILVLVIVLLWTVGMGTFSNENQTRIQKTRLENRPGNYTTRFQKNASAFEELYGRKHENNVNIVVSTPKAVQLSISEDAEDREVEFVKPMKISSIPLHEDDMLYGPDQWPPPVSDENHSREGAPPLRHHSGHFRHRMAPVWDPHPQYQFTAFGRLFHLHLTHDSGFVAPDLQVTNIWHNQSSLEHPGLEPGGCFYTGKIVGDPHSSVAVSLCHGMTGHIHSVYGSFFIEPAEQWHSALSPILHAVYRTHRGVSRHGAGGHAQDTADTPPDAVPHCGVEDDSTELLEPAPLPLRRSNSATQFVGNRSKRSAYEEMRMPRTRQFSVRRDYEAEKKREYNIEIMVVADRKMAEYHGAGLNHYILSLMHTVNKFYKHASVGNPISIAVVKIMVLKDLEAPYTKRIQGTLAPEYLQKFCSWQAKHNDENDRNAGHFDTALLLTRENLCRNLNIQKCDTLGLAELGTMCHRNSSCSIVRDNGLSAAFTIAHELGHVLNMPHDDDVRCNPFHSAAQMHNVMSRMLDNNTSPYSWSNCSRHFVTEFLDGGNGDCLLDEPFNNEVENTVPRDWLPGENFTEDQQCELVNGPGSKICTFMPACSKLWCLMDLDEKKKGCKTNHMPWADGTSCGHHRWCQQGDCIHRDRKQLLPVNGGWGAWQDFGECSRTCGGGIKQAVRFCDSPRNENGGQYCLGAKVRYKSCNYEECPAGSKDFREVQCAQHNGNNYNIHGLPKDVKWVPKYGGFSAKQRCVLYCRVSQSSDYYPLKPQVVDGTRCAPDTHDMCVNGICKMAGCSHRLGYDDKLDFCGKCGGDNSSCHWINGHYNESRYGYNRVVLIPAGSSNIDIRQYGHRGLKDDNYLALVDPIMKEYVLNGKYSVTNYPKIIPYAGAKLHYSGSDSVMERLNSSLPLTQDLVLEVLSVGKVHPPNISYKYTSMSSNRTDYRWVLRDKWTVCDKVCNGKRHRVLECVRPADGLVVRAEYCRAGLVPDVEAEACNVYCTLKWHVWSRSECSAHCGPGVRSLSVQCVQETHSDRRTTHVSDDACQHLLHARPGGEEPCEGPCDATHWAYREWGPCSVTCGGGTQTRGAACIDELEREVEERLCGHEPPLLERVCPRSHCPQWVTGDVWTPCSVSCGEGESQRAYFCHVNSKVVSPQSCYPQPVPEHRRACNERQCPQYPATTYLDTTPIPTTPPTAPPPRESDNVIPYADDASSNSIDAAGAAPGSGAGTWRTGPWGECSRTCGPGTQRRRVKCQGADDRTLAPHHHRRRHPPPGEEEEEADCPPEERPTEVVHCTMMKCPSWKYGMWGECNTSCGPGMRHRQVGCQSAAGEIIADHACAAEPRERHAEECAMPPCAAQHDKKHHRWKVGVWGQCSNKCGSGYRHRTVQCTSPDDRCDSRSKPKNVRPCKNQPCPNSWVISDWTECSVTCGTGVQRRSSVCNAVERSAAARSDLCNGETKPAEMQACHMPSCDSLYYWRAYEWQACSHACGKKGRQIRNIWCFHRDDKRAPKYNCHNESKPKRKRKCNQRRCTSELSSCQDAQRKLDTREDGEYQLTLRNRSVTIYCHQMASHSPHEFLTLPNEKHNFAEIYDRRLLSPDQCPDNGTRRDSCECALDAEGKAGLTVYKRIRLNITSFRVQTTDVSYARQVKGMMVAYAESGDCYSLANCPQGQFSIDLKGTPFRVSRLTHWEGHGSEPSIDVKRAERDQRVMGKCGGYCGTCSPNDHHGLTLEWLQPP